MWPHDRWSETSGPAGLKRSKRRTYNCELYLSGQTDSSEPVGFPGGELDGLASNPGSLSWGFEAKPDQDSVGWYETPISCVQQPVGSC